MLQGILETEVSSLVAMWLNFGQWDMDRNNGTTSRLYSLKKKKKHTGYPAFFFQLAS